MPLPSQAALDWARLAAITAIRARSQRFPWSTSAAAVRELFAVLFVLQDLQLRCEEEWHRRPAMAQSAMSPPCMRPRTPRKGKESRLPPQAPLPEAIGFEAEQQMHGWLHAMEMRLRSRGGEPPLRIAGVDLLSLPVADVEIRRDPMIRVAETAPLCVAPSRALRQCWHRQTPPSQEPRHS
eukprot:NODE_1530_length_1119_cov_3.058271.p1 GENE.NODE_1530_length_1119_cov_3.058271~~NODE_1530_length_1119_cov_3.058271.p1  ORF type:complete len:181 (-),score=17.72 NODE_1530_length_1119_cov_3.058271:35-577(-)